MLETRCGKSTLTKELNNWFGIKGKGKYYSTIEYVNGVKVKIPQQFKYYESMEDCILHRLHIMRRLKDRGYATDPNYKAKIESVLGKLEILYKEETNNQLTKLIVI